MADTRFEANKNRYIKLSYRQRFERDMQKNWTLYLLFVPIIAYYIIFCYIPMYGAAIAFQDFNVVKGILGSKWVGLKHFADLFASSDFKRIVLNTLNISVRTLVFAFPAPIILALLINEINCMFWKRTVQTLTYVPHFISLVVICGMIRDFVSDDGAITYILSALGITDKVNLLNNKNYFVPIYIISGIWQNIGWGSVIYLAALSGISKELYEAAEIDGASKFRQLLSVTIPGIMPTVITMLILNVGTLVSVGSEKILLLYNPVIYDTADVISTYVYRRGLLEVDYSFSTAVGLMNSSVNFVLIMIANSASRRINNSSIW